MIPTRLHGLAMLAPLLACETVPREGTPVEPQTPPATQAAQAAPDARSTTTTADPPASPRPQRAWHLAARLEVAADDVPAYPRLFTSDDGTLFVTSGPRVMPVDRNGSFALDPLWLRGIEPPGAESPSFEGIAAWEPEALGGRLPDGLYLSLRHEINGRADPPAQHVYRWAGTAWAPVDHAAKRFTWQILGLAPWRDDSVLALRSFTPTMPPEVDLISDEYYAEFLETVAKQRRLVVLRGKPKAPASLAKERILAFDARETGEIAAIVVVPPKGATGIDAEQALVRSYVTLHFAPDRPLQRVPIPELAEGLVTWSAPAVAWGADGVLRAWGSTETTDAKTLETKHAPLLLRFDGERWIPEPPPPCPGEGSIVAFAVDGERQWAGCHPLPPWGSTAPSGTVLTRVGEGPWQVEIMPEGALQGPWLDIVVRGQSDGQSDVWIAGGAVYRTQPVTSVVVLPGLAAQWSAP